MSTYIEVQTRVLNDYLNRTTTDFGAETKRAIQASIRHYQYERWDFNETASSVTTSSGQSFLSFPSNFLILNDLRIVINNESLDLVQRDPQWVRDANSVLTLGQPTHYAQTRNRAELFPTPNSAWAAPVYYIKSLPTLSADTDTNSWTTGIMEDVIVYHSAKLMWAGILRNDQEAAKFGQLEAAAVSTARGFNEQRRFGQIKPTRF